MHKYAEQNTNKDRKCDERLVRETGVAITIYLCVSMAVF